MTDLHAIASEISRDADQAMLGKTQSLDHLRTELKALNPQQAKAVANELGSLKGSTFTPLLPGVMVETDNAGGVSAITFEPTLQDRLTRAAHAVETTLAPVYDKGASTQFFRQIRGFYDALPSKIRNYIQTKPTNFIATDLLPDADPSLRGTPPGYAKDETYNAVRGLQEPNPSDSRPGSIILSEYYQNAGRKKQSSSDLQETFLHEVGHKVDMVMGYPSAEDAKGDNGPTFKKAYDADVAAMPQSIKDRLHYFLQDGTRGRSEAFAQCFSYIEGGSDINQQLFSIYFPNSLNFVKNELKEKGLS
jgi:hypothetical protein